MIAVQELFVNTIGKALAGAGSAPDGRLQDVNFYPELSSQELEKVRGKAHIPIPANEIP